MPVSKIMRLSVTALVASILTSTTVQCTFAQDTATAPAPVVFFDIAGQDTAKLREFYNKVFGWNIGAEQNMASPLSVAVTPPLQGILRKEAPDKVPANEVLLYLGVPDITETLAAVVANGGSIVYPRIEVPGTVIMGLFTDPAGNRFGLVEIENGKAKIPKAGN